MTALRQSTPPVVLIYGLLGLLPFLAPPLAAALLPDVKAAAGLILALYGGLILSFLGGARWGQAASHREPSIWVVSISMLPTLIGLALLVLPESQRLLQLLCLALILALHWLWDTFSPDLPAWYPRLRTVLTAGAVVGLLAGALVLT